MFIASATILPDIYRYFLTICYPNSRFHSRVITAWLMIQTSFSRSSYTMLAYSAIYVLNELKQRL